MQRLPNSLAYPLVLVLILVQGFLTLPSASAQGRGPTPVGIDKVRTEPLDQTVPIIGRMVARQSGEIAAEISGSVAEVFVDVGDRVTAGEVLAKIDASRLEQDFALRQAEVKAAKAALVTARETIALRKQEQARLERLRKSSAFNPARLEDKIREVQIANSEAQEAEANLASAEANQELARINLDDASLRAPYNGAITARMVSNGTHVEEGGALFSMVNYQDLEIEADVPAARIAGLNNGAGIDFQLATSPENLYRATVRAVVPEENARTRTRRVRFSLPTALQGDTLAVGQSVTILLPAGAKREVLSVHKDAILKRRGENIVYVIEGGAANPRPVRLGEAVGTRFEVLDGLRDGEEVVVRGNERLRPGQSVQAIEG